MPTDTAPKTETKRTAYDPQQIEPKWYQYWEAHDCFRTSHETTRPPHVIVMPPPNVTGRLHMGHALQDTIQDALTRIRRMQGYEALWLPGIDHAGIATQNVVEKELKKDGQTRHDLGRDGFVERVWDWVKEYGGIILQQKRRLGDSCDWSKERFTFDEAYVQAVQKVFVQLYDEGLIYRGAYLVNWCPVDQTALSDEEVDNVEHAGHLWYLRYPLADGSGFITIATTRPETMLGDTAVAVHPDDGRYQHLVGRAVRLPFTDREIPIIADAYVKMDFGAGALKVTPGHDKNDFDLGRKHGLAVVNIMNPDGTLNENGGPYAGLDRFEARRRIEEDLAALGLLDRKEPYKSTVPISSRSKAIIEPLVSRQWFVRMQPLAEPALAAVRDGRVTFFPKRWENEYFRWLENIRDWTISRQLWWGHRIPVWYHTHPDGSIDEGRDFVVAVEQPAPGMVQDEDVLDTWFSSWLWPFATLGWPEQTPDLARFYPGTVLVSGYDILFFWIARMIMAGLHFTGQVPYRDIFITGMIKDKQGRWMSKSLGNGIDPLDMIEQYGADAVRFSLTLLCAQGQDIKLDPTRFEMGRNFANKLWNAFNVFGQFMDTDDEGHPRRDYRRTRAFGDLELVERWMLHRLHTTIAEVEEELARYRLNEALGKIYNTFWGDYCDWYLELIKPQGNTRMDDEKIALAVEVFEQMLLLLHPFMPFVTEELWWKLRPRTEGAACIRARWPVANPAECDAEAAAGFGLVQEITTGLRNIRNQYNVPPGKGIAATVNLPADQLALHTVFQAHAAYLKRLARVDDLTLGSSLPRPKASAPLVVGATEVFVPLAGMIDLAAERQRLEKEIAQKEGFLKSVAAKLANDQFMARAPADVVEKERQKAADATAELERLRANLAELG
jgi:valyl-tRNA synthetase